MGIARLLVTSALAVLAPGVGPFRQGAIDRGGEKTRLVRSIADAWLTDAPPQEQGSLANRSSRLKLRGVQDLALVRFDMTEVRGREIRQAVLYLHRRSPDQLRYIRVSTVNQDWLGRNGQSSYGLPDGATFSWADGDSKPPRPWAWPGSTVADVIMSSGNSQGCWAERQDLQSGWIALPLPPQLIYAMAIGDSDGLAIMDGGSPANASNFVSGVRDPGYEPHLEVNAGDSLCAVPPQPVVSAEPAPERAHLTSGAIRLSMEPAPNTFCWRLRLDG